MTNRKAKLKQDGHFGYFKIRINIVNICPFSQASDPGLSFRLKTITAHSVDTRKCAESCLWRTHIYEPGRSVARKRDVCTLGNIYGTFSYKRQNLYRTVPSCACCVAKCWCTNSPIFVSRVCIWRGYLRDSPLFSVKIGMLRGIVTRPRTLTNLLN